MEERPFVEVVIENLLSSPMSSVKVGVLSPIGNPFCGDKRVRVQEVPIPAPSPNQLLRHHPGQFRSRLIRFRVDNNDVHIPSFRLRLSGGRVGRNRLKALWANRPGEYMARIDAHATRRDTHISGCFAPWFLGQRAAAHIASKLGTEPMEAIRRIGR